MPRKTFTLNKLKRKRPLKQDCRDTDPSGKIPLIGPMISSLRDRSVLRWTHQGRLTAHMTCHYALRLIILCGKWSGTGKGRDLTRILTSKKYMASVPRGNFWTLLIL